MTTPDMNAVLVSPEFAALYASVAIQVAVVGSLFSFVAGIGWLAGLDAYHYLKGLVKRRSDNTDHATQESPHHDAR